MRLVQLAQCPPLSVDPSATVLEAVRLMAKSGAGAVTVCERGRLVGVLSERDVMVRVVGEQQDPAATRVRQVMTPRVRTVSPECAPEEALSVMVANHIRHVVLVDERGGVVGMASARDVYRAHVEYLDDQVRSLEAFAGHDGVGG